MVNQSFKTRLEKYQQVYQEEYLCNMDQHEALVNNSNPDALFVSCMDNRSAQWLTKLSQPGDEFANQHAANVFFKATSIALKTAILGKNIQLVLIIGHSDCLAMQCCLRPESTNPLTGMHGWVKEHCKRACKKATEIDPGKRHTKQALKTITLENVLDQVQKARRCIKRLGKDAANPEITNTLVVGLYYDLRTAKLLVYKDWDTRKPAWLNASRVLKQLRK